jgi:CRP-like cAMP-binding protein
MQELADLVMKRFYSQTITPKIAKVVSELPLFKGMTKEQRERLASTCQVKEFPAGQPIFGQSDPADRLYILLDGKVNISCGTPKVQVGALEKGEMLGELSLLSSGSHSATAMATSQVEAAVLTHEDLGELVRRRPDIGVIIYRNLGVGLGKKLLRTDDSIRQQVLGETNFLNLTHPLPNREQ